MRSRLILSLFCAALTLPAHAAPLLAPEPPVAIAPFANVVAYAATHQIAIAGLDLADAAGVVRPGDSLTALVSFREGNRSKQWLIQFQVAVPTAQEIKDHPPLGMWTKSNTSGRTYQFGAGTPLALDIRTVGPFVEGKNPPSTEKSTRAFISPDFLELGLDRGCQSLVKWSAEQALAKAGKGPPPPPFVLSEAEERIFCGSFPALVTFFQGVQNTPGLREILYEIADKPSLWSIAKRGGKVEPGLSFGEEVAAVEPAGWLPSGLPFFRSSLMVDLNEQRALRCVLLVTTPRPPLLTTAGIVGIAAEPPDNKNKRLDVRIVAARLGTP
jgi:hypothetical protein